MEQSIKSFESEVEMLKRGVDGLDINEEISVVKEKIKQLESFFSKAKDKYYEIESEMNDSSTASNTKPLINKLNSVNNEIEIAEGKFKKKKEQFKDKDKMDRFKRGELSGTERYNTERDMIMGQHKETDIQGEIIESIANNIKGTNANLVNINSELTDQGQQIDRVQEKALDSEIKVKQTDQIMTKMQKRQKCMKIVGGVAVVFFAIFDLAWIIYGLVKKFGNK